MVWQCFYRICFSEKILSLLVLLKSLMGSFTYDVTVASNVFGGFNDLFHTCTERERERERERDWLHPNQDPRCLSPYHTPILNPFLFWIPVNRYFVSPCPFHQGLAHFALQGQKYIIFWINIKEIFTRSPLKYKMNIPYCININLSE